MAQGDCAIYDRFKCDPCELKPADFEQALLPWITLLQEITDGQIVAMDETTLRSSYDKKDEDGTTRMQCYSEPMSSTKNE